MISLLIVTEDIENSILIGLVNHAKLKALLWFLTTNHAILYLW